MSTSTKSEKVYGKSVHKVFNKKIKQTRATKRDNDTISNISNIAPRNNNLPTLATLKDAKRKSKSRARSKGSEKSADRNKNLILRHKIYVNGVGSYADFAVGHRMLLKTPERPETPSEYYEASMTSTEKHKILSDHYKEKVFDYENEWRNRRKDKMFKLEHMYSLQSKRDAKKLGEQTTQEILQKEIAEEPRLKPQSNQKQRNRSIYSKCTNCPNKPPQNPNNFAPPDPLKYKESTYKRPSFATCKDISVDWFPKSAAVEANDAKAHYEKRRFSFSLAGAPDMLPIPEYGAQDEFQYRYCSAGPTKSNQTRYEREIERCREVVTKADGDVPEQSAKNIMLYPRYTSRSLEESLKVLAEPTTANTGKFDHQKICKTLHVPYKATNEFSSYVIDELYPNWECDPRYKRKIFYKSSLGGEREDTTRYKTK